VRTPVSPFPSCGSTGVKVVDRATFRIVDPSSLTQRPEFVREFFFITFVKTTRQQLTGFQVHFQSVSETGSIKIPHSIRATFQFAMLLLRFRSSPFLTATSRRKNFASNHRPGSQPVKAFSGTFHGDFHFRRSFSRRRSRASSLLAIFRSASIVLRVQQEGFAPYDGLIEIHSVLPTSTPSNSAIAALSTAVQVSAQNTLLDPDRAGASNHLDQQAIADRPASLPGRSLQDLVNSQPGWLYRRQRRASSPRLGISNSFVVDGIPSPTTALPAFGPEIEADDVDSPHHLHRRHPRRIRTQNGRRRRNSTLSATLSRPTAIRTASSSSRWQLRYRRRLSPPARYVGKNTYGLSASAT